MVKMSGKLLIFDEQDKCGRVFPKNCNLTIPDKIPVTLKFSKEPEAILGNASVVKKPDCVIADVELRALPSRKFSDELYVGGYYDKILKHEEDGVTVIDSARLCGMSIIPKEQSADLEMKITSLDILGGEIND